MVGRTKEPQRLIRSCWAAELGDCRGPLSREHVISKGIFSGLSAASCSLKILDASGRPQRTIGVNSYVLPVLCEGHNSMLSPLDAEARKTVLGIKALLSEPLSGSHWRNAAGQAELRIDGALLERWAAKTFLNTILADVALSPEKTPYFAVSSGQLVETVFRSKPFPANQGLWLLPPDCNYLQNTDFGLSWIRVAAITSEVNWWRQAQPGWTGPWRVPVMFYFAIHRFESALLANLTSLGNEEWSTMMAVQRKALDDIGARLRPSGMTLSIPKSQHACAEAIETRTIAFY